MHIEIEMKESHGQWQTWRTESGGKQEHNENIGLGVHLNNYTDHSNIQGDVAGNTANAASTTGASFVGVAVAAEGWSAIILRICNIINAYRLQG
jgi:hypothetical protein